MPTGVDRKIKVKVWDLYLRLFHWLLLIAIATSFISAKMDKMDIHFISGHCVLALLVFRIFWGFFGSRTALFHKFIRGPRTILTYISGSSPDRFQHMIGHSPIAGLSVIAMIVVISIQLVTGLFSEDDILSQGPLAQFVSTELSDLATWYHEINAKFIIALIVLHIAAILYYRFIKKDNLIAPMIVGHKMLHAQDAGKIEVINERNFLLAAMLIMISIMIAYFIYNL